MYHGSDEKTVNDLIRGTIDVSMGGGEIGQGFYLGDMLHIAKAWAWNKHNSKAVLKVEVKDIEILNLDPLTLTYEEAVKKRAYIRSVKKERTYKFNKNIVWSPIVGTCKVRGDQFKWESEESEVFLNSDQVIRSLK
jgi:uncharacterized C2H2 Zn-finger protein